MPELRTGELAPAFKLTAEMLGFLGFGPFREKLVKSEGPSATGKRSDEQLCYACMQQTPCITTCITKYPEKPGFFDHWRKFDQSNA